MKLFLILFFVSSSALAGEVVSIRGQLFYHGTGKWSEDIFKPGFSIWNAPIGEGSLKGAAERTLFVVEAKGDKNTEVEIRITHNLKGKTTVVHESKESFGFLKKKQTMKFPVLLNNTIEGTYEVSAKIVGQEKAFTKTVNFAMGE